VRIAILGGGPAGLAAAYFISQRRLASKITVFEKEDRLGGMASGFPIGGQAWPLDKTYHHLFANDDSLINFGQEIGYPPFIFRSPLTASLYNSRIIPLDSPQDFFRFPFLSLDEKIRAGLVLGLLRFFPKLKLYDRWPAEQFLQKTMGKRSWQILWEELFRKKFGKYAGIISTAFIWARLNKRTKKLGYPSGGYQSFIDFLAAKNREQGVEIEKRRPILQITKTGAQFTLVSGSREDVREERFDLVISTLPTPVLAGVGKKLFDEGYLARLGKIRYLNALNLIVVSDDKLLKKTYWLNICNRQLPFMVAVQHTNFIDKTHYQGREVLYIGNYLDYKDPLFNLKAKDLFATYFPFLKKINPDYQAINKQLFLFKVPFSQPIFDRQFIRLKPEMVSPVKNFFIANLDMTYPYDRGVNYAIKLGREVAEKALEQLC